LHRSGAVMTKALCSPSPIAAIISAPAINGTALAD
jgi:hypothetical protein